MKTMRLGKLLGIALISICISQTAFSKSKTTPGNPATVTIKVSTQCESCQARIEKALKKSPGVQKATVDLKTKTVTVLYDPAKTNVDAIRKVISRTGYDADNVPADKKAYQNLPPCCKKEGGPHED